MDYYFIISFQLIVNGVAVGVGRCGSQSPTPDYKPNVVKNSILNANRNKYSGQTLAIVFSEILEVEKDQYIAEADSFDFVVPSSKHKL